MKKETFILILASCCFLILSSCNQQETAEISSWQSSGVEANPASSILPVVSYPVISYPPVFSDYISSQVVSSDSTEQPSSALETAFNLDIPADNAVKLSFSRIGGNEPEIVDITEDANTITTIIGKIKELEFTVSRLSDNEIRMKDGATSTICIYYQDGSYKELRNQGGWYQFTDYGEQWLERRGSLDLEQFIADEMGVQLWR